MLVIDSAPIRKKAREEYEKVRREIDSAKAVTERFHSEDQPLFTRWLHANFGAILTEIRELQERLFHVQELVLEVQEEFYFGRHRSIAAAYRSVLRQRKRLEREEAEPEPAREEQAKNPEDLGEEEKQFREAFKNIFGDDLSDDFFDEEDPPWENLPGKNGRPAPKQNGAQLKELYRKLARRLHPDKTKELSAREIEWWHQTQEAYEDRNVEQLEMILTMVEMEENGARHASVSILAQLTAEFKRTLKALKRQVLDLRKDLAWNFSKLTDHSALSERVKNTLEKDREHIRTELHRHESQIAAWEQARKEPRKRVRSRRRGEWVDEEWF